MGGTLGQHYARKEASKRVILFQQFINNEAEIRNQLRKELTVGKKLQIPAGVEPQQYLQDRLAVLRSKHDPTLARCLDIYRAGTNEKISVVLKQISASKNARVSPLRNSTPDAPQNTLPAPQETSPLRNSMPSNVPPTQADVENDLQLEQYAFYLVGFSETESPIDPLASPAPTFIHNYSPKSEDDEFL